MTAKPLPAHGTYARANGAPGYREPCKCGPCHAAHRRARKQYTVNRTLGRPGLVDATPARERLRQLHATMTWGQIATATDGDPRNLKLIADGTRKKIRRTTLHDILALQPAAPAPGKYLDATGTRRRIQALRAMGWSAISIACAAGSSEVRMQRIASGVQPTVRQCLAEKIEAVYRERSNAPAPVGRSATRAKGHALAERWAPPGAWDADTINDPAAHPEWTGHCGTDRGYWIHRLHNLPLCDRCEQAHTRWLDEHAELDPQQRSRELFKARNRALSREADLAADARELLALGVSPEQAAERLGVTKAYLQTALRRYPADTEQELAA